MKTTTSRFARSHRLAAWLGVTLLTLPAAAWADDYPDEIPYVYPMGLAQFMTPVGTFGDAQGAFSGIQQTYENARQAVIAAGNSVQGAVTAVQNVTPANVAATVTTVQQDLQNATNSVNSAKQAIASVHAVSLYGIDDQTPFIGQRLGGDGIPYDALESEGADLIQSTLEGVFARTDDITIGVTGTHKETYPDPTNHVTGYITVFYATTNTDFSVDVAGQHFNHHTGDSWVDGSVVLDDLRDQINNASGLPVTASTDSDGVHLFVKGKHKWTGNNYSVSVASVLDDAVSSPPCGTPASIVQNVGEVMCTWTGADSEVDIIIGNFIQTSGAVPKLTLTGSGANQKLTVTYDLKALVQVNAQVIADTLEYTPGEQHNVVSASVWINVTLHAEAKNLSLSPIDLDQIFTASGDTFVLNPAFVTLTLSLDSSNTAIQGLHGALESLGAEGGLIGGLILGTVFSGGNPIGTVIGGVLGLILGVIGGDVAANILEDKVNDAVSKTINEQFTQAQKQLKDEVTQQLTKYSTQIQQIKDDVTQGQAYYTQLSTLLSYLGLSVKQTYQLFNNANPEKEYINPHNGHPIYEDAVRQELAAAVEVHLPAPADRSMTVSGTLVLPEHTCNYGPTGGQGNSQQWTVDIGPLGVDEVNGDLVGQSCATILQNDLKVSSYLGSTPTQSTSTEFGAVLTPQWTPIPLKISGTALTKVTNHGQSHYECGFTLSGLPAYSITRFGLAPTGSVAKRMHLDSKGSWSNALVGPDYTSGDISDIPHAMRNSYFRTTLLGPNTAAYVASLAKVIATLQTLVTKLGSAGAPFAADLAQAKALLAQIPSFSTLDEQATPASNFRLGYTGVANQTNECPSSSDSGGTLVDDVNGNGGPDAYQMWEMYMYGSWD